VILRVIRKRIYSQTWAACHVETIWYSSHYCVIKYFAYKHECLFIHPIPPYSKDEMGGTYGMYGRQESCIGGFVGETSAKKTTWKIKVR